MKLALQPILEEDFNFIFLDCPPSLGILTCNALAASDFLIIPVQCEYLALEGLGMITGLISKIKESGANPLLELDGIVMTMYDARTRLANDVINEVRKHFGKKVYNTTIPRSVRLSEAPSFGQPITLYDPRGIAASTYRALAREFLNKIASREGNSAQTKPGKKSIFQKVKSIIKGKNDKISPRMRLERAYAHQEMDRPAVYIRSSFPANDPTYDAVKSLITEKTELKASWNPSINEQKPETFEEPYSEEFARITSKIATPKGMVLKATYLKSLKNQPGLHETFFIKTPEDAEAYLSLPFPEIGGDVNGYYEAAKNIGDKGIVEISLGMNPAGFTAELLGTENFAIFSATNRDIIDALCDRQMKILLEVVKHSIKHKLCTFFAMVGEEYIVPPLHGKQDFYAFNVKYDKPIIDLIHEAGGRIHIHSHGKIKEVFQGFLEMKVDVLHPVEAPPMGDLTVAEARKLAGESLCIEGNIQISDIYEKCPDEIRAQTSALIKDAFTNNSNLIVSPTASPYIYGAGDQCFEQINAMIETVHKYKV
jgi:hypothetical protein